MRYASTDIEGEIINQLDEKIAVYLNKRHRYTSNHKENNQMDTKPLAVTDETFQENVLDYELPVLVDH